MSTVAIPAYSVGTHAFRIAQLVSKFPLGQPVFPVGEAVFPLAENWFPSAKTMFPSAESIFHSAEIAFPLWETIFPLAETAFPLGKIVSFNGKHARGPNELSLSEHVCSGPGPRVGALRLFCYNFDSHNLCAVSKICIPKF